MLKNSKVKVQESGNVEKERLSLSLGQVFNHEENGDLPSRSSLDQQTSDLVGEINYNFSEIGEINYQYSLDHNLSDLNYNEISTKLNFGRVKFNLGIKNPNCVCYDIIFGCPGWIEGVIQAYAFIKAGMAKKCLVIGAETLSRTYDVNDRDSMIYADGAGASIVELKSQIKNICSRTDFFGGAARRCAQVEASSLSLQD